MANKKLKTRSMVYKCNRHDFDTIKDPEFMKFENFIDKRYCAMYAYKFHGEEPFTPFLICADGIFPVHYQDKVTEVIDESGIKEYRPPVGRKVFAEDMTNVSSALAVGKLSEAPKKEKIVYV